MTAKEAVEKRKGTMSNARDAAEYFGRFVDRTIDKASDEDCPECGNKLYWEGEGKDLLCWTCKLTKTIQSAIDEETIHLKQRITELKEEIDDANETYRMVIEEKCPTDEVHCTCVPHLRRRIKELETVLEPFAEIYDAWTQPNVPGGIASLVQNHEDRIDMFRIARQALKGGE